MTNNLFANNSEKMNIRDWRKALRTPPSYRIGSTTFRFHFHFAFLMVCFGSLILIFFYVKPPAKSSYTDSWSERSYSTPIYNITYPLSAPIVSSSMYTYRIGIIADMDKDSKVKEMSNTWRSYFKKGYLSYRQTKENVVVSFDVEEPIEFTHKYALNDRGMELSELVTFNGRILTFDDRTGFVYEMFTDKVVPWILLMDGNGQTSKGFKSEWATVKDEVLYVGSIGKEWTTNLGEFESFDPMYVKAITVSGEVHHLNWVEKYKAIRAAIGISWPGYMIHESAMWSPVNRKWYFLPRRCSKEKYNETRDEHMGCNVLISTEENFTNIKITKLSNLNPTHGYSSFKFVPGTGDTVIVALLTEELNGKTSTFITAFTIDGKVLMEQEKIQTDLKYEGLEFI